MVFGSRWENNVSGLLLRNISVGTLLHVVLVLWVKTSLQLIDVNCYGALLKIGCLADLERGSM